MYMGNVYIYVYMSYLKNKNIYIYTIIYMCYALYDNYPPTLWFEGERARGN